MTYCRKIFDFTIYDDTLYMFTARITDFRKGLLFMKNSTRLFVCLLIVITLLVSACSKVNTGDESSAGTSQVSDSSSINSDSSGNNESSFEGTGEESHESNETSSYDNEYLRSEVDFKDITYERPDFEEILNRINLIESLYENRESRQVSRKRSHP